MPTNYFKIFIEKRNTPTGRYEFLRSWYPSDRVTDKDPHTVEQLRLATFKRYAKLNIYADYLYNKFHYVGTGTVQIKLIRKVNIIRS